MKKITTILLIVFTSLTVVAQKKDTMSLKAPIAVVITDTTEFINLDAVRYLFTLCKKEITYVECEKLEAVMEKWLTEIANKYKLKEAAKLK